MEKENQFLTCKEVAKVTYYYSIEMTDFAVERINGEIAEEWEKYQEEQGQSTIVLPPMTKESLVAIWKCNGDISNIEPNVKFWQGENNKVEFENWDIVLDFVNIVYNVLWGFVSEGEYNGCEQVEIEKRIPEVKNNEEEVEEWLDTID